MKTKCGLLYWINSRDWHTRPSTGFLSLFISPAELRAAMLGSPMQTELSNSDIVEVLPKITENHNLIGQKPVFEAQISVLENSRKRAKTKLEQNRQKTATIRD